jgi:aromatic amino acid transport protein AroP
VLLGYALAGIVAFFIMRQLGEMVVDEPVAGSFSYFANKYCGHFAGFMSGWNYWVLHPGQHGRAVGRRHLRPVLVARHPDLDVGAGLLPDHQRDQPGQREVVRRDGILVLDHQGGGHRRHDRFGGYLLATGTAGPEASIANLWQHGGFFPNGFGGLVMAMAVIMFSFGGLELVGITAAEADNPGRASRRRPTR